MVGTNPSEAALYEVSISHLRSAPVRHGFRYRSYMWLLDPDAPPRLPRPLRPFARFDPADHLDIRAELDRRGITAERLMVLTNLRVLGYVFNPISVYWCYGPRGDLVATVAEVHNTYGGRHAYVIGRDDHCGTGLEAQVKKEMYVSPFYPVDGSYSIRISEPRDSVAVSVKLDRPGDVPFKAALSGRRRPASAANLIRSIVRFPVAPLGNRARIQMQGIALWRRGVRVQPR